MKLYIIKHKGKTWFGNLDLTKKYTINDKKFWVGDYFIRLKDAKATLETYENKEFFETTMMETK